MKKIFKTLLLFAAVISLSSCGGGDKKQDEEVKKESLTLKPETIQIKGGLADYYTVVDREYKATKDGILTILSVEVERNDTPTPFDPTDICYFPNGDDSEASMLGGFGFELLDDSGNVIDKEAAASGSVYGWDEVEEVLRLRPGETGTIRFTIHPKGDEPPTKFRITSDLQKNSKSKASAGSSKSVDKSVDEAIDEVKKQSEESLNTVKDVIEAEKAAVDLLKSLSN